MADIPLFTGSAGSLPSIAPATSTIDRINPAIYGEGAKDAQYVPSIGTSIAEGIKSGARTEQKFRAGEADIAAKEAETELAPLKVEALQYAAMAQKVKADSEAQLAPQLAKIELLKASNQALSTHTEAQKAELEANLVKEDLTRRQNVNSLLTSVQGGSIDQALPEIEKSLPDIMRVGITQTKSGEPVLDPGVKEIIASLPQKAQEAVQAGGDPALVGKAQQIVSRFQKAINDNARTGNKRSVDIEGDGGASATGSPPPVRPAQQGTVPGESQGGQNLPTISGASPEGANPQQPGAPRLNQPLLSAEDEIEKQKRAIRSRPGGEDMDEEKIETAARNRFESMKPTKDDQEFETGINEVAVMTDSLAEEGKAIMADFDAMVSEGIIPPMGAGSSIDDTISQAATLKGDEAAQRVQNWKARVEGLSVKAARALNRATGGGARGVDTEREIELLMNATVAKNMSPARVRAAVEAMKGISVATKDKADLYAALVEQDIPHYKARSIVGQYERDNPGNKLQTMKAEQTGSGKDESYPLPNTKRFNATQYLNLLTTKKVKGRDPETGRAAVAEPVHPKETLKGISYDPDQEGSFQQAYSKKIQSVNPLDIPDIQRGGVSDATVMRIHLVESGGNPKAHAEGSTAKGLGQFIDDTGKAYWKDLHYDKTIGEYDPYDPYANAAMTAEYMNDLLDTFGGDTRIALAGYNQGEPTIKKTYDKLKEVSGGRAPSWEKLRSHLPETIVDKDGKSRPLRSAVSKYVDKVMGDSERAKFPRLPAGTTTEQLFASLPSEAHRDAARQGLSARAIEDFHETAAATSYEHIQGTPLGDFFKMATALNPFRDAETAQAEEPDEIQNSDNAQKTKDSQIFFEGDADLKTLGISGLSLKILNSDAKARKTLAEGLRKHVDEYDSLSTLTPEQKLHRATANSVAKKLDAYRDIGDEETSYKPPQLEERSSPQPSATQRQPKEPLQFAMSDLNPFRGPDDAGAEEPGSEKNAQAEDEESAFSIPAMQALAVSATRTALFGWDNEILGGLRSMVLGEPYEESVAKINGIRDALAEKYPGYTKAGIVLGAVAGLPGMKAGSMGAKALARSVGLIGKAERGAEVLGVGKSAAETLATKTGIFKSITTGAKAGATAGAVQGAGDTDVRPGATLTEALADRAIGAVKGGAVGSVAGGLVGGVIGTGAKIARTDLVQNLVNKVKTRFGDEAPAVFSRGEKQAKKVFDQYSDEELADIAAKLEGTDNEAASALELLTNKGNPKELMKFTSKNREVSGGVQDTVEKDLTERNSRIRSFLEKEIPSSETPSENLVETLSKKVGGRDERVREVLSRHGKLSENVEDDLGGLAKTFDDKNTALENARANAAAPLYKAAEDNLPDLRSKVSKQGDFNIGPKDARGSGFNVDPDAEMIYVTPEGEAIQGQNLKDRYEALYNLPERVPGLRNPEVKEALQDPLIAGEARQVMYGPKGQYGTLPLNSWDVIKQTIQNLSKKSSGPDGHDFGVAANKLRQAAHAKNEMLKKASDTYYEGSEAIRDYNTKRVEGVRQFVESGRSKDITKVGDELLNNTDVPTLRTMMENFNPAQREKIQNGVLAHIQKTFETQGENKSFPDFTKKYFGRKLEAIFGEKKAQTILKDLENERGYFEKVGSLLEGKNPGAKAMSLEPKELRETIKHLEPDELAELQGSVREHIFSKFENQGDRLKGAAQSFPENFSAKGTPQKLKIIFGEEKAASLLKGLEEERGIASSKNLFVKEMSPTAPMSAEVARLSQAKSVTEGILQLSVRGIRGLPATFSDMMAAIKANPESEKAVREAADIITKRKDGVAFLKKELVERARKAGVKENLEGYNKVIDMIAEDPSKFLPKLGARAVATDSSGKPNQRNYNKTYLKARKEKTESITKKRKPIEITIHGPGTAPED